MRYKIRLLLILLVTVQTINAKKVHLSGFVNDSQTKEVLIGANIWIDSQQTGTTTDNHGYFSLKVNLPVTLYISYIGYKTKQLDITGVSDSLINIQLATENNLNEVTVIANKENNYDVTRLSSKELLLIPTIGGKPDLIKTLQLLPGVQTQSEGMSLLLVRGGEPGQNQYLLDNVPLIYVNHLGGLMSVFNPDMINSVDFYKGNFPARQGGKLSSIVDITQREGDISKHQGSFSLGITDVSFSFEGPLSNKKMSYIVTARKTLIDALIAGATTISAGNNAIMAYGFHDINAKLTWRPNEKNNLSMNLYQGDDYLNYWTKPWKMHNGESSHIAQQWGNWLVSGRWNSIVGATLYAENILSFSRYRNISAQNYGFTENDVERKISLKNMASVNDFSYRTAWKYSFLKNWKIEVGGQASYLHYEPNYNYLSTSNMELISTVFRSFETALYLDNKIQIIQGIKFQPSVRLTNFSNNGVNFPCLEPRLNLTFKPSGTQSFNLNYMKVSQSSHLVFAQAEIMKREIWLPATAENKPEISNQFSVSWNGSYKKGKYTSETNIYIKKMENLVTLKEGYENMTGITGVENKIENNGEGIAYGAEFMFKKNSGKWTGSASYAWSYANRQFANINGGKAYEFDFNRPHSITLNVNHDMGKNWIMSAVWIIQSGTPYTPALGKQYTIDTQTGKSNLELIYGAKNSDRMQPYHRLDIGFNHTIKTKRGNKAVWTYSIYNAYNHINPFDYYCDNDNNTENQTYFNRPLNLYKIGLFSIIPSIAYKVYFDYKRSVVKPIKKREKKKHDWLYF